MRHYIKNCNKGSRTLHNDKKDNSLEKYKIIYILNIYTIQIFRELKNRQQPYNRGFQYFTLNNRQGKERPIGNGGLERDQNPSEAKRTYTV